mgnify:CR=1 FL=1
MPPVHRIYIAGFMGVGKSTVAPRVAKYAGFSSIDLDTEISAQFGLSIPAIFELMGEDVFRKAEEELLIKASTERSVVVSLGGGAVCRQKLLDLCLNTGMVVYLKSSPQFLAHRLAKSRGIRPKLFDAQGKMLRGVELENRVEALLQERKSFYEQAHITVHVDEFSTFQIARQILDRIKEWH